MHSTFRWIAFLLVLPLLALQKPAPPQPQEQLPVIRSIVEVVNVLCTVKDKKGRIISDLDKKDFTVLEEGGIHQTSTFSDGTSTCTVSMDVHATGLNFVTGTGHFQYDNFTVVCV